MASKLETAYRREPARGSFKTLSVQIGENDQGTTL